MANLNDLLKEPTEGPRDEVPTECLEQEQLIRIRMEDNVIWVDERVWKLGLEALPDTLRDRLWPSRGEA